MALTIEQIHATADTLAEQGIKPTLANVRKELGGGSFTTISEAMQTWRQEQEQEQQLQQVDLPSSINDRLSVLGAEMWQSAIALANERLSAEREALAAAQAAATAEVDEAKEAVKTLENEQSELLEQLDELTNSAELARIETADSKKQLAALKEQSAAEIGAVKQQLSDTEHKLDLQRQKTETTQATADDARNKLDDVQAQLMQAREAIATYKATQAAQSADIERLSAELADSKQQHDKTRSELEERTAERDSASNSLATAKGKLDAVTAQIEQLIAERDKLNSANNDLTIAVTELKADNKRVTAELKAAQKPIKKSD